MAYSFDGANDKITFGSDSSIDAFTQRTIALWLLVNDLTVDRTLVAKQGTVTEWLFRVLNSGVMRINHAFSSAYGEWQSAVAVAAGTLVHVAVTYDNGSTGNDAVFYADGATTSVSEIATPSGTANSDAARTLHLGETAGGTLDLDGLVSALIYDNAIWSAEDINRARWWGTRGGSVKCFYPFLTDANNRGTATANGTVTGAVKGSLPRVERNWGAMMGVGR
jgi:hypothetical protein